MKLKDLNIFWKEALLFSLTQILGIIVAIRLSKLFQNLDLKVQPVSLLSILVYFFVGTLIVLIFLKISKRRSGGVMLAFFILAVFSGLDLLISIFIIEPIAAILAIGLIVFRFVRPTVLLHNLIIVGSLAGIGGMLGLTILPRDAIILLIILAIYDVIAVYKTKHMVKMAEEMIKKRVILGVIIPEKISGFQALMEDVENDKIPVRRISSRKTRARFMILGGGDLVLPLFLISSVAIYSVFQAIIILVFALFGLFAMHLIFIKLKSRPMPALPPLAVFSILGYLVSLLV